MARALIVVDVQNGFVNEKNRHAILRIKQLLDANKFEHVIFTKFINKKDSPYQRILGWYKLTGSPETDIVSELQQYAKTVFEKNIYSVFTSEFVTYLEKNKIDELYIVGIDTECCVLKIAVDAFEKGYKPYVLAFYCASHSDPSFHEAGLKILEKFIGKKQITREEF